MSKPTDVTEQAQPAGPPNDVPPYIAKMKAQRADPKVRWRSRVLLACVAVAGIFIVILHNEQAKKDDEKKAAQDIASPEAIVRAALGDTAGVDPKTETFEEGLKVSFHMDPFAVTEWLSQNYVDNFAKSIVPKIFWHFPDVPQISIHADMMYKDIKGNERREDFMQLYFTRETAATIHWDKINVTDVPALADKSWVHP